MKNIFGINTDSKIMFGASDMIRQLAEEEEKLIRLQTEHMKSVQKPPHPKTDMALILSKYVSKNLNQEAYKFIKLNPNLSYSEVTTQP